MRGALCGAVAGVLAAASLAAVAAAGGGAQDTPKAPLRFGESKQPGRLAVAQFSYRAGPNLCVTQEVLGDGAFPVPRTVGSEPPQRARFRLNSERRPKPTLEYWTQLDEEGNPQGESTPVPIEAAGRKPDGDFVLKADLAVTGKRYLRLSANWKGKGRCTGQELLRAHYALKP